MTTEKIGETPTMTDAAMRLLMVEKLEAAIAKVRGGDGHQLCLFVQDNAGVTHANLMVCSNGSHALTILKDVMDIAGQALVEEMMAGGLKVFVLEPVPPKEKMS